MAKSSNREVYKNAIIDVEEMTITEIDKEETRVQDLRKVLEKWDKVDGISISISKDCEILPDRDIE